MLFIFGRNSQKLCQIFNCPHFRPGLKLGIGDTQRHLLSHELQLQCYREATLTPAPTPDGYAFFMLPVWKLGETREVNQRSWAPVGEAHTAA